MNFVFKVNIVSSSVHPPLTLVLGTLQAVYWQVTVPEDVIIDHVFLVSFASRRQHGCASFILVIFA